MRERSILTFLILYVLWGSTAKSQIESTDDHLGSDFLQPQISAGFSTAPVRNFQDIAGTFSVNSATVMAAVPIYRALGGVLDNSTTYFVLTRVEFSSVDEDISFLSSSNTIYKTRIGVTGGIATTHHHLYLLTLGGGFAEDHSIIDAPKFRGTGSLLGKYQLEDSFAFIYGLSYSYTFNRGLLLPLLGVHCALGSDMNLHMILPFSLDLDYHEAQELRFGFVIRANGDQIHVGQDSYVGHQTLPLYLKIAQIQIGFRVSYMLSNDLWLVGEAGALRNRNFAIGTTETNLVSSKIENSRYSTIIFKYDFGNFESWGE